MYRPSATAWMKRTHAHTGKVKRRNKIEPSPWNSRDDKRNDVSKHHNSHPAPVDYLVVRAVAQVGDEAQGPGAQVPPHVHGPLQVPHEVHAQATRGRAGNGAVKAVRCSGAI